MCTFKVGDKVKTRNGQDVEIICVDDRLNRPVVGIRTLSDGNFSIDTWSKDGRFLFSIQESQHDIIPPSRTVTLYRVLVRTPNGRYYMTDSLYESKDSEEFKTWSLYGHKVVRFLTEYPIEVELL